MGNERLRKGLWDAYSEFYAFPNIFKEMPKGWEGRTGDCGHLFRIFITGEWSQEVGTLSTDKVVLAVILWTFRCDNHHILVLRGKS